MPTLSEIRTAQGAQGVRAAIVEALRRHGSATAAAESLGTNPSNLRRAAHRAGVDWPELPDGPTPGNARMAKVARAAAAAKTPTKGKARKGSKG